MRNNILSLGMRHSILSLGQMHFKARIALGGCLINIGGETLDCDITVNYSTYVVSSGGKELCTFRDYHLTGGPFLFQIEGASEAYGDATLIVPGHGLFGDDDEDDDVEDVENVAD